MEMGIKRTLSIGDIHGRDYWKFITHGSSYEFDLWKISIEAGATASDFPEMPYSNYDKIIFVGDYVDSFTYLNVYIKRNLEHIIFLKKALGDKVVLLLGNHDIAYIIPNQWCQGHRPEMKHDLYQLFTENADYFQIAYQEKNYLWTHAGVTSKWYENLISEMFDKNFRFREMLNDENTVSEILNYAWLFNIKSLYDSDSMSGGSYEWAGPLWVRPTVLKSFPLEGYKQIIGHTPSEDIIILTEDDQGNKLENEIYRIDCLYEDHKHLELEI